MLYQDSFVQSIHAFLEYTHQFFLYFHLPQLFSQIPHDLSHSPFQERLTENQSNMIFHPHLLFLSPSIYLQIGGQLPSVLHRSSFFSSCVSVSSHIHNLLTQTGKVPILIMYLYIIIHLQKCVLSCKMLIFSLLLHNIIKQPIFQR